MAARKRKRHENFEEYRKALKAEELAYQRRKNRVRVLLIAEAAAFWGERPFATL
jgi:hypothetical protein